MSAHRELGVGALLEGGRIGLGLEARPQGLALGGLLELIRLTLAHRWHPEQCSGGFTFSARARRSSGFSSSGFQAMFVI